jgi:hypothetical protein
MSEHAKVSYEKVVTIDDIVTEANRIWKYVKSRHINPKNTAETEKLTAEVQRKHPQFCQSYPLVNRYLCQVQEYSAIALRKWLGAVQARPWKSEDEYLQMQCKYPVILYKILHPNATKTALKILEANILNTIRHERDSFKERLTKAESDVVKLEESFHLQNKRELREFAQLAGPAGLAKAETITVRTNLPIGVPEADLSTITHNHSQIWVSHISADDLLT